MLVPQWINLQRSSGTRMSRSFVQPFKVSSSKVMQVPHAYAHTVKSIKDACMCMSPFKTSESMQGGDGRITSAVKEKDYLDELEVKLKEIDPDTLFERPPDRFWYDVRINKIPINLKLTMGGTDNVFNKKSIIYTLTGDDSATGNMNFNDWYKKLLHGKMKEERDRSTEYHFLVVNKETSEVLLKSILDIHTFKSNPCNDLQINWKNEFKHIDYVTPDELYEQKAKSLVKMVQTSVKQYMQSILDFASADIDKDLNFK